MILALAAGALLVPLACSASEDEPSSAQEDPSSSAAESKAETFPRSSPPPMTIDPSKKYTATLSMEKGGDIVIELAAADVPNTVNNFVFLARAGFFDGITFHRVIPGFMAQSGDPTGTGSGGPGYQFADEFSPNLRHSGPGVLSMANRGPNTNGSQFFITYAPTPHLDNVHSVFGKVVAGMDVVEGLPARDPSQATSPGDVIKAVTIQERE